jgi:hypothetical protein
MPKPATEFEVRLVQAFQYAHVRYVLDYKLPVDGRLPYRFAAMVYGKDGQPFGLIDYEGTYRRRGYRDQMKGGRGGVSGLGRVYKAYLREKMYHCLKHGIRYYRVYRNADLDTIKIGLIRWLRLGWAFGRTYDNYHADDDFISSGASLVDLARLQGRLEEWKTVMDRWELETPHVPSCHDGNVKARHKPVPPVWKLEGK